VLIVADTRFDEWIADHYELLWPELFDPLVLDPAVRFLADLAGADTAAVNPGARTMRPAGPSSTPSPRAIRGSNPTGSVSVMTTMKAPSAMAPTDAQPRRTP